MLKSRCFTHVPEHELVILAACGLEYSIRKKLDTHYVRDMSQLADRVRHVELLKAEKTDEKAKTTHKWPKKEKIAYIDTESICRSPCVYQEISPDVDINDINLAELQPGDPYVCKELKPYEKKVGEESPKENTPAVKTYTFDVTKCDAIYDILVFDGLIVVPKDQKLPSLEQRKGKNYCKYHNFFCHWTSQCVRFRDLVQGALDSGRLKYGEKAKGQMKIDSDPLQKVEANYVEPLHICMVDIAEKLDLGLTLGEPEAKDMAIEEPIEEDVSLDDVYLQAGETLVEFLSRSKDGEKEVMLCPRCSVVFDKSATKAYQDSEMKKHYQKKVPVARRLKYPHEELVETSQEHHGQKGQDSKGKDKSCVPNVGVPKNQWFRPAPPKPKPRQKWQKIDIGQGSSYVTPRFLECHTVTNHVYFHKEFSPIN